MQAIINEMQICAKRFDDIYNEDMFDEAVHALAEVEYAKALPKIEADLAVKRAAFMKGVDALLLDIPRLG